MKAKLNVDSYVALKKQGCQDVAIAKYYRVSKPYVYKIKQKAMAQGCNLDYEPESLREQNLINKNIENIGSAEAVFDFNTEAKNFIQRVLTKKTWTDEKAMVSLATLLVELAKK